MTHSDLDKLGLPKFIISDKNLIKIIDNQNKNIIEQPIEKKYEFKPIDKNKKRKSDFDLGE